MTQPASSPGKLILVRHGQSIWNVDNLFTGWTDVDLSPQGMVEARQAGIEIKREGLAIDIAFTSVLKRAIRTLWYILDETDRMWVPVERSWRLNERHYGDLTGRNKAETTEKYGEDKVKVWRRSYDTPPPPITADNEFNPNDDVRYASLPPELVPDSECLADVVERMLPYWFDAIVTDLAGGGTVLVVAHGNSLRALVKHLDGISDDEITELNIPTGVPLLYELGDDARPTEAMAVTDRYLMDPEAVRAKAEAVARQASGG